MCMNEPSLSVSEKIRIRYQRLREFVRKSIPFISGMVAALLALFLYNFLFPGARPLTQAEVDTAISSAMASATPRPSFASQVYQIIQPSLVWIEARGLNNDGEPSTGLGAGVIIDTYGNILTSLHVVADSPEITLTFADGSRSRAVIAESAPEQDIALLQADRLPEFYLPATLGN